MGSSSTILPIPRKDTPQDDADGSPPDGAPVDSSHGQGDDAIRLCGKCFEEIPGGARVCPHCQEPIPEL